MSGSSKKFVDTLWKRCDVATIIYIRESIYRTISISGISSSETLCILLACKETNNSLCVRNRNEKRVL